MQPPPLPPAWKEQLAPVAGPEPLRTGTISPLKVLLYLGVGFALLVGLVSTCTPRRTTVSIGTNREAEAQAAANEAAKAAEAVANAADAATPAAALTSEPSTPVTGSQWSYSSEEEGMSGKSVHSASVSSTNTIDLDFPYAGAQHGELRIRRHPRWGNDVILSIERGQLLCHSYGDCAIGVRFDDGKVLRFDGNPPADNSSEYAFIPAFSTFMKQLPNAKKVRIEVQIYQAGSQVFEFDVSGFDSTKLK